MKKRILGILLTLCIVICLAPTGVFADGETVKNVAMAQELIDALADGANGTVRLAADIDIAGSLNIFRTVTLDLNGHVLKMTGSGSVIILDDNSGTNTGDLTLVDSDPTAEHKFKVNGAEPWTPDDNGTEVVCGGIITGGTGTRIFNSNFAEGGGVNVGNGVFTMTGGNIVGCTAYYGGGVNLINGSFTMSGGSILGCSSIARNESGEPFYSGIYAFAKYGSSGTFTMTGGVIKNAGRQGVSLIHGITLYACGGEIYDQVHVSSNCAITYRDGLTDVTDFKGAVEISKYSKGADCGIFYGGITAYGNTINGLTVTYKDDAAEYARQILQSGKAALKPDAPAKDDYAFIGWYDGETPYDFARPVTGDITLTAKWVKIADKTADFTAADGGAAAIALLNSAKTGAADSTWDNGTKTLTLRGIHFVTTATTAVKLPDGATVILADGTENRTIGGGATAAQDGTYRNKIYVYGIYAAGSLTVQGETKGTGALYVNSGDHINNGDAWTNSIALCMNGDLTVRGGSIIAQGGKATGADGGFSYGIQFSKGANLSVAGGTLTAVGGESFNTEKPDNVKESFSAGIDIYGGDVTVSGSGKLIAENVPSMAGGWLSYGLNMMSGSLTVKDGAAFSATARRAVNIYDGDIILMGGKLSAFTTSEQQDAVSVMGDSLFTAKCNIEISGGTFECVGGIYMSMPSRKEGSGVLSVAGGKLTAGYISGANTFSVSGGTVTSGRISATAVELSDGSLTVREPIHEYSRTGALYAYNAIYCGKLTVSGGTLDAAWDWGKYAPITSPIDPGEGCPQPLIRILDSASFGGGTVILDAGCAGNTALKAKTLELSGGVRGSGYTHEDGSDTYIQKDGSTPVKFTVYPADYAKVDAAIAKAKSLNKDEYKDFSAVDAAVGAVVRGKNIDEQAAVDAMAKAIEDAIAALEYKGADYGKVDAAIAKAKALSKDEYKDFSAVDAAVNSVVRGKNITEQAAVDAMAKAIEDAINALEMTEPVVPPATGDNSSVMLWIALLFISGGVCTALTVKNRKARLKQR